MATRSGWTGLPIGAMSRGRVGDASGDGGFAAGGGRTVQGVERARQRHRDAGEDRGVAERVGAGLGSPQLLHQVQELARVVRLEGDYELLVVEAERVGGVDG